MYKKVFKNIKKDINKKEKFISDIFKAEGNHGIHDKKPHLIFSSENPIHPSKLSMDHDKVLEFLKSKGYSAESMTGKYNGSTERSIIIHNPPKNSFRHLNKFAAALGQDSAIISDGYDHELHYLNGPKVGTHYKGRGTVFHEKEPTDYYSTLEDGTHFTHAFDFEKRHNKSNFINDIPGKLTKSEDFIKSGVFLLKKAEDGPKHKLALAGPGTKLIHYSSEAGIKKLDPEYHGTKKIGTEAKQGAPRNKMTYYYAEGVEPEDIVTTGASRKYVVDLGNKRLYDVGKDPAGLYNKSKEIAQTEKDEYAKSKGWAGKSMVDSEIVRDKYHKAIQNAGYHGIYNSNLDDTMSHAVGMFHPMSPEAEYPIHQNDFKKTSSKNYHNEDVQNKEAKRFAKEYGHHNHNFLHNLRNKFEE